MLPFMSGVCSQIETTTVVATVGLETTLAETTIFPEESTDEIEVNHNKFTTINFDVYF